MTEIRYTVVFKGETAKGHTADEVQRKIASTGVISADQLNEAFRGRPLMMKDLPRERALTLVQTFESAGALCEIEVQRQDSAATPQGSQQQRPPQRTAQRPAQRPAERPQQPPFESIPAPPVQTHNPEPSGSETITCAKCGYMQTRGVECVKCGVLFDKIETVTELANDPDRIAREILERYRPLFRNPGVFLTPAIPSTEAIKVLRPYLATEARWEDDEQFIINNDEELIAIFNSGEKSDALRLNFLLTNFKMMIFRSTDGPICAGFDLWTIVSLNLVGENKSTLVVGEKALQLPVGSERDQESREIFIKMASEIARALKQSARAARLQAKRAWEADPHRGRQEPPDSPPPHIGGRGHKGRITLSSLDLRDLNEPPLFKETGEPEKPSEGRLLSSVKGLFKKK